MEGEEGGCCCQTDYLFVPLLPGEGEGGGWVRREGAAARLTTCLCLRCRMRSVWGVGEEGGCCCRTDYLFVPSLPGEWVWEGEEAG